jgi:hypothetical protein
VIILIGALIFAVGVWLGLQPALTELDEPTVVRTSEEAV